MAEGRSENPGGGLSKEKVLLLSLPKWGGGQLPVPTSLPRHTDICLSLAFYCAVYVHVLVKAITIFIR